MQLFRQNVFNGADPETARDLLMFQDKIWVKAGECIAVTHLLLIYVNGHSICAWHADATRV